jgi:hypothetical protein
VTDAGEGPQLTLRWENDCQNKMLEHQDTVSQPNRGLRIRKGDRLLVFEDQLFPYPTPCAVVPATEENLRAAQQGVSENFYDPPPPLTLPVGSINPPHVEVR